MKVRRRRTAVVAILLVAALWLLARGSKPSPSAGDVPYVPSRAAVVERMLEMVAPAPGDLVYDLGSGDGRIVIRAAERFGARGLGVELNPELVTASRRNAAAAGVADRVEFVEGDLFDVELSAATAVTLYLLPSVNLRLRPKLIAELGPGTRVVSQSFDMREWEPDETDVVPLDPPAELYIWTVPASMGGVWRALPMNEDRFDGLEVRLTQSFQLLEGEVVLGEEHVPLAGRLDGAEVLLEVPRGPAALPGRWQITGTVEGEVLRAVVRVEGAPTTGAWTLSAQRQAAAIGGLWAVEGGGQPWALWIEREGRRWGAWRSSAGPAGRRPLGDFYVWGGSIYFVVGEQGRRVIYRGLVDDDAITGTVLDAEGELRAWSARRQ